RRTRHSGRMVRRGIGRHAAEPIPRPWRSAGVQCGRRITVVRRRGPRALAVGDRSRGALVFAPAPGARVCGPGHCQWIFEWHAILERFWNDDLGRLADVVDVDHVPGTRDDSFRPNQILAVGGLPVALVDGARARQVVDAVEQHLLTPFGLRSLAPGEPGYAPR